MVQASAHCAQRSSRPGRRTGILLGRELRLLTRAPQFYAVIVAATLVGMAINFLGINPITALVLSAVLNGLIAAPLLVLVMLVSNDRRAMGERTNGRLLNVVGWVTTIVMGAAAISLVVTTIVG